MKRKFWILIGSSLIFPLILLGLGGLYFLQDRQEDQMQFQAKSNLKTKTSFYEEILNKRRLNISKNERNLKIHLISLFSSLPVKNSMSPHFFVLHRSGHILFPEKFAFDHPIAALKKSLDKNESIRGKWFVKINRKKDQSSLLFYFKKWEASPFFLVSKQELSSPALFTSQMSWLWLVVCGLFGLFIFSLLFFVIRPLFVAYESLKSAFIYLGKTGIVPSWLDSSQNSFLQFYKNWSFLIHKRGKKHQNEDTDFNENKTFQDIAEEEVLKIKEQFPQVSIGWSIKSDLKLWGFSYFIKRILRELLLNAVEAMGGNKEQDIRISAWEKENQFFFSIQDKGCGLLDEDSKKVLDLYYSTKSQLGVGLNIVQSIVSSNQGALELFPLEKEKGLEVQVSFPLECFLQLHFQEDQVSFSQKTSEFEGFNWREEFLKKEFKKNKPSSFS